MIINLTRKPFTQFTPQQKWACDGETVLTPGKCENIDDFYNLYDNYVHVVTKIIVNPNEDEFNNDVQNAVDFNVMLVTLDVEIICELNSPIEYNFKEYNP